MGKQEKELGEKYRVAIKNYENARGDTAHELKDGAIPPSISNKDLEREIGLLHKREETLQNIIEYRKKIGS